MRLPSETEQLTPEATVAPTSSAESPNESEYLTATERSHVRIPRLELMSNESNEEKVPLDDANLLTHTHRSSIYDSPHKPKFAWLWKYLSLKGVFHLLGRSIAMCPQAYFVVSALIASLSCGMYFMVLKDQIRDGYTPTNAASRFETDVMREFWNSSGDPIMSVVLLTATDNGSMLRNDYIKEAVRLHDFLLNNFTLDYEGEKVKYNDLCFPYCNMNYVLNIFYEGLQKQVGFLKEGKALDDETVLSFPVSKVGGFKFNLERSFFGLKRRPLPDYKKYVGHKFSDGEFIEGNQTANHYVTDVEYVKVIMMIFRGDRTSIRKGEILSKWETSVYDFAMTQYNNSAIEMQVIGTEILDQEMIRDGQRLTPFFAAGFGFMMLFVVITVIGTAILYDEFDIGKVFISFGATFCPLIAVSTTYGLVSLLGFRINSFVLVSPFLICGIGVDDAFLMIHAWQRLAPHGHSIQTRMGLVYEEVGPSITITSLTNFISFGIGALTPTPEIRLFCMTTAIAMGIDYIFELILFGPMLVIATRFEKPKENQSERDVFAKGWRRKVMASVKWVLKQYCKVIGHRVFSMLLLAATATYWYFAIYGALNIQTRLDSEKILPRDSPIQKPNKILSDIIWAEYHPVTVIVNNPFDITNPTQYQRFWNLVNEFESLERCKGNISTLLWLRDYETYFKQGDMMESLLDFFGYDMNENATVTSSTGIDFSKLDSFLQSPFSRHWTAVLKHDHKQPSNETFVKSFWFTVSYRNTSSWDSRINLMIKWREIASRYEDLNVTVWEANAMFVDQMLSLKTVALQTGLLTLVCMAVVCAVFIPNPCSLITASIAIASISLGVLGFLSWWHLDLDPVTVAAILMSIGLSVDFTAHVSYYYQLTSKKVYKNGKAIKVPIKGPQEKLVHTLENIAWPMVQAATSTVVCILPLLFLKSYAPIVFVKAIFLVVAWGTLHGLLVLPGLLAMLPDSLTTANCYRTFLSTSSHYSCRYVGPSSAQSENKINDKQLDIISLT